MNLGEQCQTFVIFYPLGQFIKSNGAFSFKSWRGGSITHINAKLKPTKSTQTSAIDLTYNKDVELSELLLQL